MAEPLTFTKVERGWYATEDGTYCVVVDGYEVSNSVAAEAGTGYEGFIGGEWALVYDERGRLREDHGAGQNLDWFKTKREAVAASADYSKGQ